jgi:hypothetical protein
LKNFFKSDYYFAPPSSLYLHSILLLSILCSGCEKLHNSYFAQILTKRGHDPKKYFQGSVQLDGGLISVTSKIINAIAPCSPSHNNSNDREAKVSSSKLEIWKSESLPVLTAGITVGVLRIGSINDGNLLDSGGNSSKNVAARLASGLLTACLSRGVNVVVPTSSGLYDTPEFIDTVLEISNGDVGLAFGQPPLNTAKDGSLYVMDARGVDDTVELLTGLAACGCHSIVVLTERKFVPQHPIVPVTIISPNENTKTEDILRAMATAHKIHQDGNIPVSAFQITRGLLSVSV